MRSRADAFVAENCGAEMDGADLMKEIGRRAKPALVYTAYRRVPRVMSRPTPKLSAFSPLFAASRRLK